MTIEKYQQIYFDIQYRAVLEVNKLNKDYVENNTFPIRAKVRVTRRVAPGYDPYLITGEIAGARCSTSAQGTPCVIYEISVLDVVGNAPVVEPVIYVFHEQFHGPNATCVLIANA